MAVIALPNVSPQGPSPVMEWGSKTFNEEFESPLTGQQQTYGNGANVARQSARLTFENLHRLTTAPVLKRFLVQCRGKANSFFVPDYSHTLRGSFPATELLTNNHFASGTTGWTGSVGADTAVTASDGVLRLTRIANDGTAALWASQAVTATQYAPYALRVQTSRASPGESMYGATIISGGLSASALSNSPALSTAVLVVPSTSTSGVIDQNANPGAIAGSYREVSYASLARCMLVDNTPNMLLRSNDGSNASWTKNNSTSGPNGTAAPDGSSGDQNIQETTDNGVHDISQAATVSASAADYSASVYLHATNRTWAYIQLTEGTGSTIVYAFINLSTGALGQTGIGANWANFRTFVQSLGDGWYRLHVVARKTNAATGLTMSIGAASADGTTSYVGVENVAFRWWRASLAQSSVPVLDSLTTSAASSGTSQTGGALRLKGLPASTNGLLLAGDPAEIILPSGSQFVRTTASLNSDAAGLGYWQFEPPLRSSPADGAAVIVCRPLMRAHLADSTVRWTERLAGFMDCEFEAVEDMV